MLQDLKEYCTFFTRFYMKEHFFAFTSQLELSALSLHVRHMPCFIWVLCLPPIIQSNMHVRAVDNSKWPISLSLCVSLLIDW